MAAKKTFAIDVELSRGIEAAVALRPHGTYISVSEIVYRMHENEQLTELYNRFRSSWVRYSISMHLKKMGYHRCSGRHAKNPVFTKLDYELSR